MKTLNTLKAKSADSLLCVKGVNDDVLLVDSLMGDVSPFIPEHFWFGMATRWLMGISVEVNRSRKPRLFIIVCSSQFKRCVDLVPNCRIIKFEDILQDPFKVSEIAVSVCRPGTDSIGSYPVEIEASDQSLRRECIRFWFAWAKVLV